MFAGWKKFTNVLLVKKLRLGKGAVIEVVRDDNTVNTLSLAEQAVLDGVTAGTVAASKAVVVDSNKDVTGFRHVTGTGTAQYATLTATTGITEPASDAITAFATGGQASATALVVGVNRIGTCATAGDSVKLPAATAGRTVVVINNGATAADVFPQTGETINGMSANTAIRIGVGQTMVFNCSVAAGWRTPTPLPAAKYTKNTTVGATTAAAGDLTGAAYTQAEFSAVGAANLTTRTATQMIADGFLQVGDSYVLEITNTSGGTTTLVAGTGITLTGTMTMATNTTRRFNVRVTGAAAITIQSTGVGTIS